MGPAATGQVHEARREVFSIYMSLLSSQVEEILELDLGITNRTDTPPPQAAASLEKIKAAQMVVDN